jgi:hypothetical protein
MPVSDDRSNETGQPERTPIDDMERRRKEWIAGGSIPEEKPNFFSRSGK